MMSILFWACVAMIIYVYAGYPLIVFCLAALIGKRPHYPTIFPAATVLIAAYNEESVIGVKLENCLALDYPREKLQILVAVDGVEDRTAEIVRSFSARGVELSFSPERRGKVAGINRAMKQAKHDIIIFSDANNDYEPGAIKEMTRPFADPSVGAVSGSKMVGRREDNAELAQAEGLYWRYESFTKEMESRLGCCIGVSGEQFAIRKNLFTPPPEGIINDDFYITLQVIKQGYNVVYAPAARSRESVSASQRDEIVRRSRIVAGRYQIIGLSLPLLPFRRPLVVWQIISHKYLRPLVPFFMLTALITNIVAVFSESSSGLAMWLSLRPPAAFITLGAQTVFYTLAMLGGLSKPRGPLGKLASIPSFLVSSNYAAVLGLIRYISGQQTALWKKVAR